MTHVPWAELPADLRAAVIARTGPIVAAHDVPYGITSAHVSVLEVASGRPVFVKAGPEPAEHAREALLSGQLSGIAPPLRWRLRAAGWDVIGFDALPEPRHTHLRPDSPDLPLLADLLTRSTGLPAVGPLPAHADQFIRVASSDELALLDGDALVHGDINQHNALVSGGRAWLVDWAMACRGPVWVDVAEAAVRLMEDGHRADQAHHWASRIPAWQAAGPAGVSAWCAVRCRALTAAVGEQGARGSVERHRALARCVRAAGVAPPVR